MDISQNSESDGTNSHLSARRAHLETTWVIVLAGVWFFWGLGVGDFVQTEGLRAIVVKEMLEPGHGFVPTVHGRTYLRKLPLYAWTTMSLSRVAGRFDEQISRIPSAVLGVVFILTLHFAGRALIDPRAGPASAAMGAGCWEVLDYGMRAELDIGVLATTTLAVLLLGEAWRSVGARRIVALVGCYVVALIGTFWKAPHVLVTVWLALLGLSWWERRLKKPAWWRFALHPAQVILSVACCTGLITWFTVLAGDAGSSRVGRFFLFELLARVIPHSLSYLKGLLAAPFQFIGAGAPACLFALLLLHPMVRRDVLNKNLKNVVLLLAWSLPCLIFLFFVSAKSTRYYFLVLGAICLLSSQVWRLYVRGLLSAPATAVHDKLVNVLYVLFAGGGFVSIGLGVLLFFRIVDLPGIQVEPAAVAAVVAGSCVCIASLKGLRLVRAGARHELGTAFVIIMLSVKPIQVVLYLPARSAMETRRPIAQAVDRLVPPGKTVYILSDKPNSDRAGEMAGLGIYCQHTLRWPPNVDDALAEATGDTVYLLVREKARDRLIERFKKNSRQIEEFNREDDIITLLQLSR